MAVEFLTNIYFWMIMTFAFILIWGLTTIFLIILAKKTHAVMEFKAWLKGTPISLFFQDNRRCEWKAINPEGGIIHDKEYGSFIINEKANYVDRRTNAILMPFSTDIAGGANVKAAKLADDLTYVIRNEEKMKELKWKIANNMISDDEIMPSLRTNVHFGALKDFTNAILPHNVNSKIQMAIAAGLRGFGRMNPQQMVFAFLAVFGAIIGGFIMIKMFGGQ